MDDEIFTWTDATGATRKGDPLDLLRRLNVGSPRGDVNVLLEASESTDEGTAIPGAKALAALVCRVFSLGEPWDDAKQAGVLERRWRAVLNSYLEHLEKTAPPASAGTSDPEPSDCPPATGPGTPATSSAA